MSNYLTILLVTFIGNSFAYAKDAAGSLPKIKFYEGCLVDQVRMQMRQSYQFYLCS